MAAHRSADAAAALRSLRDELVDDPSEPGLAISLHRELSRVEGGTDRSDALARYSAALEEELWTLRESRLTALRSHSDHHRLVREHGAVAAQALQDPLTGLPNRRALDLRLREISAASRRPAVRDRDDRPRPVQSGQRRPLARCGRRRAARRRVVPAHRAARAGSGGALRRRRVRRRLARHHAGGGPGRAHAGHAGGGGAAGGRSARGSRCRSAWCGCRPRAAPTSRWPPPTRRCTGRSGRVATALSARCPSTVLRRRHGRRSPRGGADHRLVPARPAAGARGRLTTRTRADFAPVRPLRTPPGVQVRGVRSG